MPHFFSFLRSLCSRLPPLFKTGFIFLRNETEMFQIQLFLSSNERLACRSNPYPNIFPLKSPKNIQKRRGQKPSF